MQKPYEEMTQSELWGSMNNCNDSSVELRKIHKCLKKYHDGVPFMYRYQNLPIAISIMALVFDTLAIALLMILHL